MIIAPNLADEIFRRRTSDVPSLGTVAYANDPSVAVQAKVDALLEYKYDMLYAPSDRSKWERVGQPMVENIIDFGIIIYPRTPPKLRQKAIQRRIEKFIELM